MNKVLARKNLIFTVLILFLIQITPVLYAQQNSEQHIFGKILDDETKVAVPGVHILNKNSNQGTVSDIDGNFALKMSVGDSLLISSVAYQPHLLIFTDSIEFSQDKIIISIQPATIELAPVKVFAYKSAREFKNAVIALELPEETTTSLVIPGYYYGPKKEVKTGFGSPISFLVGKFGKKAKQEKKFKAAKERDAYRNLISSKYNKEIVEKITGLKAEALKEFMDQCTLSDSFIENANEYDIIVAINNCFEEYRNNN